MTTSNPRPYLANMGRDADLPDIIGCEAAGPDVDDGVRADHDYRREDHADGRTYLVCVWCRAVSCGNHDQGADRRCIEPWHHEPRPHRTLTGATWPIGGNHPADPQ